MRRSLLALGILALPAASCGDPSFVDKVIVANPYEYNVHAEVSDGRSGWLNLGEVAPESEETNQQVVDMGPRWVFRFRFRDLEPVEVSLSRSELVSAGWRVEVPETLAQTLRARGEPPSYRGG
jgi:hypothetical protein